MTMRFAIAAVAAVSLAGLSGQALAQTFNVKMNGANEKPTSADPKGTGTAKITIKDTQVCWDIQTHDLPGATMAHIHKGGPDAAGPVAVALTPPDASGHSASCVTADAAVAGDIAAHPGDYYVNVHTATFKGGAIRGQLK